MANIAIIASPEFGNRLQEFGDMLQLNDFKFENKGTFREEAYNLDFDIKRGLKFVYFAIMFAPSVSGSIDYYINMIDKFKSIVEEHVLQTNQPVYIQTDESTYVFDYNTPKSDYQEFVEELKAVQLSEEKKSK